MSLSVANSATDSPDVRLELADEPQPGTRQVVVQKRTLVQGRPAAYSVAGAGLPIVMLHGWALADHTYRDVIASMASLTY